MRSTLFPLLALLLCMHSAQAQPSQTFTVTYTGASVLPDYMVQVPLERLKLPLAPAYKARVQGQEVPVELVQDLRGQQYALLPIPNATPGQAYQVVVQPGQAAAYPKRTYAELTHKIGGAFEGNRYVGDYSWVKPNSMTMLGTFRDHAYYIKYEGPGWESDKVAFRFYLDQRNAIDVFAKRTTGIVLPGVGVDGYDSYHAMAPWGMDNMKVGKALGLGSIAMWDGTQALRVEQRDSVHCHIAADGKLRSQVATTYYGWSAAGRTLTLQSLISIDAGSRASRVELLTTTQVDNLATGIIKIPEAELIVHHNPAQEWMYIATFGRQSLNNDMMGLVIFAHSSQVQKITQDPLNHVLVLTPTNGYVEYYLMPTWELDVEPIVTKEDFVRCLEQQLQRLNAQVKVK